MRLSVLALVAACSGRGDFGPRVGRNIDPYQAVLDLAARDLSPAERAKLDHNGLVITTDPAQSFHVGYTALFHAHKPVYITADSLLYAWHSSYDKLLREIEVTALEPALADMLQQLRAGLAKAPEGVVRADLDVYLAVAASLASGKLVEPVAGGDRALIADLVKKGEAAAGEGATLFGQVMELDWTMLKPRGHYTYGLERYFRAMSWLGRAEIRIGRREPGQEWKINQRALGASVLLASLFTDGITAKWSAIDGIITALVGPQDSMSLPAFVKAAAKLGDAAQANTMHPSDAEVVAAFEQPSKQKIRTQLEGAGVSSIAFLLLGQRYVFDANVLGDLVYDHVVAPPGHPERLMPSPLDVAAAVFHNPAATPLLAPERDRYGQPYTDALAALSARPIPDDSVAHVWLQALRELSPDATRDAGLPAPMQSDAWMRRMMGTQLASWAELRHDNLLYTKQSFTAELGCEFPDAYVDPYPAFYAKMELIAQRMRAPLLKVATARTGEHAMHYLDNMAKTMAHLRAMAERERANQPLTSDDMDFVNHMVSLDGRDAVCTVTIDANGWYADLFWERNSALYHDPVIADVHTQPTDEAGNSVGQVLHVATGRPLMSDFHLHRDDCDQTYRGFVSSYAELVTDNFQRLTDDEWRQKIQKQMVPPPAWLGELQAR